MGRPRCLPQLDRETASEMSEEESQLRIVALEREVRQLRSRLDQDANVAAREALLTEAESIAHLGSWMWVIETGQVYWSDEMFRILGRDPISDVATVDAFFGAIHPEDLPSVQALTKKSFESGLVEQIEFRIVTPTGALREVVMDGSFIRDEQGEIRRMVGSCLDISRRRQVEGDARRAQQMLEMAEQLADVGVFFWQGLDTRAQWSPEMYKIFGTAEPLDREQFISVLAPDDAPVFLARSEALERESHFDPVVLRIQRPTGEQRHILMSARLVGADGVAGSIVDITERIQLEAKLRQAQKMDALGRLAGGIAHDFNNLLTVILGNASDLLEETPDNELVAEVVSAAEQAAAITRQLLAFSRNSVVEYQPLILSDVIPQGLTMIRRIIGPDIRIIYEADDALWPICVDAGQVMQILMNLVLNARDALQKGGQITIAARNGLGTRQPQRDMVSLTVSDNGIGMTDEQCRRAFEPFFTTKQAGHGTGLGLSVVYSLVEQQRGLLHWESAIGKGTSIRIDWPRVEEKVTPSGPAAKESVESAARTRILLVEDEPAVRRWILKCLELADFEVSLVGSGAEALEVQMAGIGLLIIDIVLPDGRGPEFAAKLRARNPDLAVLYISGHAADTEGLLDGAFLAKPFKVARLLEKIREVLSTARVGVTVE